MEDASTVTSFEGYFRPPKGPEAFPELVGMDLFRAECLVKQWGYYTRTGSYSDYKRKLRKLKRDTEDVDLTERDPCRVMLWLDSHGYVATTPKVG